MKLLRPLALVVISVPAPGYVLVFPPNPTQHHVPPGIVRNPVVHDTAERATTATKRQHTIVAAAAAAEGGGRGDSAAGSSTAKERFLSNLERKRAGEDVRSALSADLSLLSRESAGRNQAIDPRKPPSWRGKWEICYAPHIETLGKVILTKFGSVQYNFVAEDGRMVSHAEYENAVFGSGWFNADGRVVPVPAGDGMARDDQQDVVKVGGVTIDSANTCPDKSPSSRAVSLPTAIVCRAGVHGGAADRQPCVSILTDSSAVDKHPPPFPPCNVGAPNSAHTPT